VRSNPNPQSDALNSQSDALPRSAISYLRVRGVRCLSVITLHCTSKFLRGRSASKSGKRRGKHWACMILVDPCIRGEVGVGVGAWGRQRGG